MGSQILMDRLQYKWPSQMGRTPKEACEYRDRAQAYMRDCAMSCDSGAQDYVRSMPSTETEAGPDENVTKDERGLCRHSNI